MCLALRAVRSTAGLLRREERMRDDERKQGVAQALELLRSSSTKATIHTST
jgi:hypothetical protein